MCLRICYKEKCFVITRPEVYSYNSYLFRLKYLKNFTYGSKVLANLLLLIKFRNLYQETLTLTLARGL